MNTAHIGDDEVGVIAGILDSLDRDLEAVREIVGGLPAEAFTTTAGDVYAAVRSVVETMDRPVLKDVQVRLREHGHDRGMPADVLFVDAVADTFHTGPQATRLAREAAARLRQRYERRLIVEAAKQVIALDGDQAAVAAVGQLLERTTAFTAKRTSVSLVDAIDKWARNERTPRIATGFRWTDGPTKGGLPIGGIVAIAAPPGDGKTALALQWTIGALLADPSLRAVWAAGELTPDALAGRAVVVASRLLDNCPAITTEDSDLRTTRARRAAVAIAGAIGDRMTILPPPLTVDGIEAAVVAKGAKLVVIDYLQLIRGADAARDRVADLDCIVGRLREIAIVRELAIVVVSSMATATTTTDHAGKIGRGTSEIGYAVELLYVAEVDKRDGNVIEGIDGMVAVTWRCRKARNLRPTDLVTRFDGTTQTYRDGQPEAEMFVPFGEFARHAPAGAAP
jgi:replicative DNA helicase